MSDSTEEVEVSDDDLELAAGGLKNITSTSSTYSYNSTIYFQASISSVDGA